MGQADAYAVQAVTTGVKGTLPTLTVSSEHSSDGQNWIATGWTEIADVTKILGTHGYAAEGDWAEARLVDEQPESSYLVKDVEEGQQPFRLYALERFRVVGEKEGDYVVKDGCYLNECIIKAEFPGDSFTNFHRPFQVMR
jgi:hypothetical protein